MPALKAGSRPPWVGLAAAVWVQIASGNAYAFPLYSLSLKSVLGLSQQQLTILGVANDFGENVGILPGIASNKYPPWVVLLIGVLASFFGYGVIWLAVSETVHNVPYWVVSILLFFFFTFIFERLCSYLPTHLHRFVFLTLKNGIFMHLDALQFLCSMMFIAFWYICVFFLVRCIM